MPRRFGDKDKILQRQTRSDTGKHHKTYRGKPIKERKRMQFQKRIGNKSFLKLRVMEIKPMSVDGYKRFNRYIRPKMRKEVYIWRMRHDVHISDINTKQKIEKFMERHYWKGTFLIMGYSHGKNKWKIKSVKMCKIVIRETDHGNKAKMVQSFRMHHYRWFYKG